MTADRTPGTTTLTPDVAVVGGGPAGLTAATVLASRLGEGRVLVLEREAEAGGIPRHSDHTGYGVRDLKRLLTGPSYARSLAARATAAGARVHTRATVTGMGGTGHGTSRTGAPALDVTTPEGRLHVRARAVVLATGARERPRPARLIPGDRPPGVLTTGQLQNLVHLHGRGVGRRAVIAGAEPVSWSAALTLREAGCTPVLMTTVHPVPESYAAFHLAGRPLLRLPVATRTRITRIAGRRQLTAVEIENTATGARTTVGCDTLVLTGDWIPDHELARDAGLDLDPRSKGPLVDTALRTSQDGVFAAGNLLHPVDTADVAALDGRHAAAQVLRWLDGVRPQQPAAALAAEPPLRWVAPALLRPGDPAPPRGRLLLWTDRLVRRPRVTVRQGTRLLARRRLPWPASPGRAFRLPYGMLAEADPGGDAVRIEV
jgi:thioredoxin reductase